MAAAGSVAIPVTIARDGTMRLRPATENTPALVLVCTRGVPFPTQPREHLSALQTGKYVYTDAPWPLVPKAITEMIFVRAALPPTRASVPFGTASPGSSESDHVSPALLEVNIVNLPRS